jgi:hypothetical protein
METLGISLYSYLYLKLAKTLCFSYYLLCFFSNKTTEQEGRTGAKVSFREVVQCLPSKHDALNSNLVLPKEQKKEKYLSNLSSIMPTPWTLIKYRFPLFFTCTDTST